TTSKTMRSDVINARDLQSKRFQDTSTRYNAQMTSRQVRTHCPIDRKCTQMLRHCVEELGLSARAHDKILRVARTITDVAGCEQIREQDLAEAIGYRSLDRELWI
ncbi:MAG: magnesium chelatase, partial [Deltaproteobacteria bacterium]|nr:magnesium chelatase [Deltaproteobacteria bacterium]